ncbi:hypothetical protein CSQ94_03920 [Janthinobacterium sp. BJB312]|nr:hypothetical protein CSQ94_03920 [Janthinobacterium sp. BJB312]
MPDRPLPTFYFYSRHQLPNEEAELAAFAAAVMKADLATYIEEAMYDSNSNCCYFKFHLDLSPSDEDARTLLAIATNTISQFEWFGSIEHGNGFSEEEENPWFKDKKRQVVPSSITAFGIHLDSRYGKASELMQMLHFAQTLAGVGLATVVERVEYDSKAAICFFDFSPDFSAEDPRADEVLDIALATLSHFDWFGDDRFGLDLRDQ